MSDAGKWPKSFRWHTLYRNEPDIVTFLSDKDIVEDAVCCVWSYDDCLNCNAWEPTGEHRKKSPPAPSQDGRIQELLDEVRMYAKQADVRCSQESKNLRLIRCIEKLADAVERLAK